MTFTPSRLNCRACCVHVSPPRRPIGRNGADATTATRFPKKRTCPTTFTPGKKDSQGGGIDLATTQNVRWVARLGGAAYGNPTVAAGRVFVGTDDLTVTLDPRFKRTKGGMVKCFDEATGKLLWQLVVPQRTKYPRSLLFNHQDLGVCSSPTVDGDRVYVVTCAARCCAWTCTGRRAATAVRSATKASIWPATASRPSHCKPPTPTSCGATT